MPLHYSVITSHKTKTICIHPRSAFWLFSSSMKVCFHSWPMEPAIYQIADVHIYLNKFGLIYAAVGMSTNLINFTRLFVCEPCDTSGTSRPCDKAQVPCASDQKLLCTGEHRQISTEFALVGIIAFVKLVPTWTNLSAIGINFFVHCVHCVTSGHQQPRRVSNLGW